MSSRSYVLAFLVSSLALAGAAGALAACTTETTVVQGGNDAASDAPREVSGPKDSGPTDEDAGQTQEECIAACEKQFAAGLTKDKAIDTCWSQKCDDPCIQGTGTFDAGTVDPDAGDGGDGGDAEAGAAGDGGAPACMNDVNTSDNACDLCTKTNCCQAWDDCFNDKDCSDLNDCRSACQ